MGTLGGHLLPGSFFIIFALWWSFITAIRYIQMKLRSPFKKNTLVGYHTSVTMPCICLPCGRLRRAPVESWLKLIFGTIGLLGEIITGVYKTTTPRPLVEGGGVPLPLPSQAPATSMEHEHAHEHEHHHQRRDAILPNVEMVTTWHYIHGNAQHVTMYSAFVLGAVVEILMHYRIDVPPRLDYACGLIAFSVEAFLFANHLHAREPLDVHVHVLLTYAILGCVLFAALETWKPNQIMFTYGRIMCTLLQGTWFFQVGFVLYPPTDSPAWMWDLSNHDQIMTITMTFCWHIMFIVMGLLLQLAVMKRVYKSKRVAERWDELIEIDEEALNRANSARDPHSIEKFISVNSEDEDSIDEQVEFDTAKLIRHHGKHSSPDKMKMAGIKSSSPGSTASSTSGNFSINTGI